MEVVPVEFTVPDPNDAESTITVDIDVEAHDEIMLVAAHNSAMATTRNENKAKIAQYQDPQTYVDNEEFKQNALKAWGVEPGATQDDVRNHILESEVKPLREELAALEQRNKALLESDRNAQIFAQLGGVIKQEWIGGDNPAILPLLTKDLEYNQEEGQWCVKDGKGGYVPSKEKGASPFATISEYCQDFLSSDAAALYKIDQRQTGPGPINPSEPGGQGTVKISRADSKNHQLYKDAKALAKERGTTVELT